MSYAMARCARFLVLWCVFLRGICASPRKTVENLSVLPPNVDLAGQGLHTVQGAIDGSFLCTDDNGCDSPGFAAQVFNVSSGLQIVGWTVKPAIECDITEHHSENHDWYDYSSSVSAYRTTEHHGLFHHSSHTDWFSAINEKTIDEDMMFIRKTAVCKTYQIRRNIFDGTAVLTSDFRTAVANIPVSYNPTALQAFVTTYGDAVLRWALFGGRYTSMSAFARHDFMHLKRQQGSLESSATLNILCQTGDTALCQPGNPRWGEYVAYNQSIAHQYTSWIPFPPADESLSSGASKWQQDLLSRPGIIAYETENITELMNPLLFPLDPLILARRAQLEKYLFGGDFCHDMPAMCPALPPRLSRWSTNNTVAMPFARCGSNTGSVMGGSVYVVDGDTSGTPDAPALRYDAGKNSWGILSSSTIVDRIYDVPALYSSALEVAVAAYGQLVVKSGGIVSATAPSPINAVLAYNTNTNTWSDFGALPVGLYGHCMVAVNGMLLVFGGRVARDPTVNNSAFVLVYEPVSRSWEARGDMPIPSAFMTCTVYNNDSVLLIGGQDNQGNAVATVRVYTVATDAWAPVDTLPPMSDEEVCSLRAFIFSCESKHPHICAK